MRPLRLRGFLAVSTLACSMLIAGVWIKVSDLQANAVLAQARASALYRRITGVPLALDNTTVRPGMESALLAGNTFDAAMLATQTADFLNVTARLFADPMTNQFSYDAVPLNETTAVIVGAIRDDLDFRRLLTDSFTYRFPESSLPSPRGGTSFSPYPRYYSESPELHYTQAHDELRIGLESLQYLPQPRPDDVDHTAFMGSSKWAGDALYMGTNRRAIKMLLEHTQCTTIEQVADSNLSDHWIRRDVDRSPAGNPTTFGTCKGCHAILDSSSNAFAYHNGTSPTSYIVNQGRLGTLSVAASGGWTYRELNPEADPARRRVYQVVDVAYGASSGLLYFMSNYGVGRLNSPTGGVEWFRPSDRRPAAMAIGSTQGQDVLYVAYNHAGSYPFAVIQPGSQSVAWRTAQHGLLAQSGSDELVESVYKIFASGRRVLIIHGGGASYSGDAGQTFHSIRWQTGGWGIIPTLDYFSSTPENLIYSAPIIEHAVFLSENEILASSMNGAVVFRGMITPGSTLPPTFSVVSHNLPLTPTQTNLGMIPLARVKILGADPATRKVIAAYNANGSERYYLSNDGGVNYVALTNGIFSGQYAPAAAIRGNTIYATMSGAGGRGALVWRSSDGGQSFEEMSFRREGDSSSGALNFRSEHFVREFYFLSGMAVSPSGEPVFAFGPYFDVGQTLSYSTEFYDNIPVSAKMNQNSDVFPAGRAVIDHSFSLEPLAQSIRGSQLGFRTGNLNGYGPKELGTHFANTRAFSSCMAKRVFKVICGREPAESEASLLQEFSQYFESVAQYRVRELFARAALYPACVNLEL